MFRERKGGERERERERERETLNWEKHWLFASHARPDRGSNLQILVHGLVPQQLSNLARAASVFKAAVLVYWKEKSWTQYFAFFLVVGLWLKLMYFVLYTSATAGCWSSKENFSQNSIVAKRKWHSWTLAGTVLLSHVQFWNLNGKFHCMEKPASLDQSWSNYEKQVAPAMHRALRTAESLCTLCPPGHLDKAHLDGPLPQPDTCSGRGRAGNLPLGKASFHNQSLALH